MNNKTYWKIPMSNLQLFADGGDGGDGGADEETLTFDDFLALEGNQAEFDKRLQAATQTAVNDAVKKEAEKWKVLADTSASEAEKLAKMTKQEQAEYKIKKLEEELAETKRKEAKAELTKEARKMLSEKKINVSDDLLEHLVADDAEKTKAAVESFVKLFNDTVNDALKEKARQETPREGGGFNPPAEGKLEIGKMAREARIIK